MTIEEKVHREIRRAERKLREAESKIQATAAKAAQDAATDAYDPFTPGISLSRAALDLAIQGTRARELRNRIEMLEAILREGDHD